MFNNTITWGYHYWPYFLIVSATWILFGFGVPEGIAIASRGHADNTLSNYARVELHVPPMASLSHTIAWWLSLLVWSMFAFIMTLHIWFMQPIS